MDLDKKQDKIISILARNSKAIKPIQDLELPEVHNLDGELVSKDYLIAILVAYAIEPVAGLSFVGGNLAKSLNKEELEVFAQFIYTYFLRNGAEAKYKWILYFSSIHGGDVMVEKLKGLIDIFVLKSRGAMAGEVTKAITLNPSPMALVLVDNISRKYRHKQVKSGAVDALEFAAMQLNISREEFSDRIVPNFGFDENSKVVIDYGKRSFDVYINTELELEVFDNKGKKLKTMPVVGKTDDESIATEALKEFKALKKQLRETVSIQRDRLELALSDGRKWSKESYENLFIKNPVMRKFAIGLIWGIYKDGELFETFRYMEDGTFNSVDENEITLIDDAIIGLVHPMELSEKNLSMWKQQLIDYEIDQPFLQLNRTIYRPLPEELNNDLCRQMYGREVYSGTLKNRIFALGWERGQIGDGGTYNTYLKVNNKFGVTAELRFSGDCVSYEFGEDVTIYDIKFYDHEENANVDSYKKVTMKISSVNDRLFSEVLNQVEKAISSKSNSHK